MFKVKLFFNWQLNLEEALIETQELEQRLEYQRYEADVINRVLGAAQDEEDRTYWKMVLDVIGGDLAMTEGLLHEQQQEAARCTTVLAVIKADLDAEGIDPNDYNMEDFIFDDFDDDDEDFDYDFDLDAGIDIPFNDDEIPF